MTTLPRRRVTSEDVALWARLREDGLTNAEIAVKLNVAKRTLGRHLPPKPHKAPEGLADWEALLDEGYSYQHVAEIYGVAKATVRKYFPGRGWVPEQVRAHGVLVRNGNRALTRV